MSQRASPDRPAPAAGPPGLLGGEPGWVASTPRHERKYLGSASRADQAEDLLGRLCLADAAHAANEVHSVYFDTTRLAAYWEKADGQYRKEKVRLRWYEPGAGRAWLEIKARQGALGFKWRKEVPFAGLAGPAPDEGGLAALLARHLGSALRPVLWLSYRRRRFVVPDGSARVALDRDVRVRWASPALAPRRGPGALPVFVVEVKGARGEPPPWLSAAIGRVARSAAVSKYALCVDHARGGFS